MLEKAHVRRASLSGKQAISNKEILSRPVSVTFTTLGEQCSFKIKSVDRIKTRVASNFALAVNNAWMQHDAVLISDVDGYQITRKKLHKLFENVKDMPVAIYSIAGAFRKGKSFMLNLFMKYLTWLETAGSNSKSWMETKAEIGGFSWSGGSDPNTQGILIYSRYFVIKDRFGKKTAVFLMDTQGLFDRHTSYQKCIAIFALSTLISSVQIYNLTQQIQEDHLQQLKLFTDYAQVLQTGTQDQVNRTPFQSLWFLIRDWPHPSEGYGLEAGRKYLDNYLKIENSAHDELATIRQNIKESFAQVSCCLLPYPGEGIAERSKAESKIVFEDMKHSFKEHVNTFVKCLFGKNRVVPKEIGKRIATGQNVLDYILSMITEIKSSNLPNIQPLFQSAAEQVAKATLVDCTTLCSKILHEELKEKSKSYLNAEELFSLKEKAQHEVLNMFNARVLLGGSNFKSEQRIKLELHLKQVFANFEQANGKKLSILKQTFENHVKSMLKEYSDGLEKKVQCPENFDQEEIGEHHKQISQDTIRKFQQEYEYLDPELMKEYRENLNYSIDHKFKLLTIDWSYAQMKAKQSMHKVVSNAMGLFKKNLRNEENNKNRPACIKQAKEAAIAHFEEHIKNFDHSFVDTYRKQLFDELETEEQSEQEEYYVLRIHETLGKVRKAYQQQKEKSFKQHVYMTPNELSELHKRCGKEAEKSFKEDLEDCQKQTEFKLQLSEFYAQQLNILNHQNELTKSTLILSWEQTSQQVLQKYQAKMREVVTKTESETLFQKDHDTEKRNSTEKFKKETRQPNSLNREYQAILNKLEENIEEEHKHNYQNVLQNQSRILETIEASVASCTNDYKVFMDQYVMNFKHPATEEWLEAMHEQAKETAQKKFQNIFNEHCTNEELKRQQGKKLNDEIENLKNEIVKCYEEKQTIVKELGEKCLDDAIRLYQSEMTKVCLQSVLDESEISEVHENSQNMAIEEFKKKSRGKSFSFKDFEAKLAIAIQGEFTRFRKENRSNQEQGKVKLIQKRTKLLRQYAEALKKKAEACVMDDDLEKFAEENKIKILNQFDQSSIICLKDHLSDAREILVRDLKTESTFNAQNTLRLAKKSLQIKAEGRSAKAMESFRVALRVVKDQYFEEAKLENLFKVEKTRALENFLANSEEIPPHVLGPIQENFEKNLDKTQIEFKCENSENKEFVITLCYEMRKEVIDLVKEKLKHEKEAASTVEHAKQVADESMEKAIEEFNTAIMNCGKKFDSESYETETRADLQQVKREFIEEIRKQHQRSETEAKSLEDSALESFTEGLREVSDQCLEEDKLEKLFKDKKTTSLASFAKHSDTIPDHVLNPIKQRLEENLKKRQTEFECQNSKNKEFLAALCHEEMKNAIQEMNKLIKTQKSKKKPIAIQYAKKVSDESVEKSIKQFKSALKNCGKKFDIEPYEIEMRESLNYLKTEFMDEVTNRQKIFEKEVDWKIKEICEKYRTSCKEAIDRKSFHSGKKAELNSERLEFEQRLIDEFKETSDEPRHVQKLCDALNKEFRIAYENVGGMCIIA